MAGIIIAGFGGQGVLVLGQMITYAGMIEDKAVSWFPSYGPRTKRRDVQLLGGDQR